MLKKSTLLMFSVILCITVFSQNGSDSIQISKVSGNNQYALNGQILTLNSMSEIMQDNQEAKLYLGKAKGSAGFANILAYVGGFMIGYPIGTMLGGGEPNWAMAGIGCGIVVVAIPIYSSANKNMLRAVETYNQGIQVTRNGIKDKKLGINQNGLALVIRF